MPATVVQSKTGSSTLATTAATWNTAATAGNLLVIVVASDDYAATPPTGFTQSTEMGQLAFLGNYLWWKVAAGGETSVNYVIGSATISVWITLEISGLSATPYDISAGQFTNTNAISYTTKLLTPTAGGRYILAVIGGNDSPAGLTSTLSTWLNSFVEIAQVTAVSGATAEVTGVAAFSVTANGSTSYSSGATYSNSGIDGRTSLIIAFNVAAAVGGGTTITGLGRRFHGFIYSPER